MSLINEALQRARDEALRQEAVKKGVPLAPLPKRREKSHWLVMTVVLLSGTLAITAVAILGLAKRLPNDKIEPQKAVASVEIAPVSVAPEPETEALTERVTPPKYAAPAMAVPPSFEQPAPADRSNDEVTSHLPDSATQPTDNVTGEDSELAATDTVEDEPVSTTETPPSRPLAHSSDERNVYIRHADLGDGLSVDLGGIAWSETGPYALMNGRVVGVGESVSGFVVRKIDPLRVVMESQDRQIVLKLK